MLNLKFQLIETVYYAYCSILPGKSLILVPNHKIFLSQISFKVLHFKTLFWEMKNSKKCYRKNVLTLFF